MNLTEAEQRIVDGTAWDEFCDALKDAGQVVQSEKAPKDPLNRAEGYRYLTRLLRGGLESFLEHSDADFPVLRCICHETIKLGADNPDNRYETASINSKHDYRISGYRGSVDYLGLGSVINLYGSGGGMETTGYVEASELTIADDGYFEIVISQQEQPGNWLPMGPETNSINVRQTFQDRDNEVAADLKIERIGAEGLRPEPLTAEKLDQSLRGAMMFVQGASYMFEDWAESFVATTNQLPAADQEYCQSIGGDPNIFYFHSAWALAEDEALVLEAAEIPECKTWNFQLDNWWMESLDYRYHNIHFNKHTAHYEPDGSVKIVVAEKNPGHPNWVETAGHRQGSMCWRWIGAQQHPPVTARVVKLADL